MVKKGYVKDIREIKTGYVEYIDSEEKKWLCKIQGKNPNRLL